MFQDANSDAMRMPERNGSTRVGESNGQMLAWAELPSMLLRRWRCVVGGVAAGLVAALLAVALLPARYTASTEVLVQPTDLKAVEGAVNQVATQPDTSVALIETAARVLVSRRVLEPVVAKLNLADDPEFQRHPSVLRALVADLRNALDIDSDAPTSSPAQIALEALGKHLAVHRSERTFVINLAVKSKDPEKAAQIAKAIVASFFAVQGDARTDAARQVSDTLTSRLAGLRDGVRRSEDAVQAFKAANNLATANGQIVNEQQLSEASAQLLAAEKATADAKAKLAQLESARRGQDPGAIPESLGSQTVRELRGALAQVRRREAYAATIYGDRFPQLEQIRSEVAVARRALDGEVQRIRDTARGELERAQASETNLRANLTRQQATATGTNATRIKLRELERDADASRGIYQDFLRRARETGEQERVDTLNAWVISPAVVPTDRSFPPSNLLMFAAGFVAGLALGLGLTLWRERTDPRLWTRSRVEAATGVPVLATIDASHGETDSDWQGAGHGDGMPDWPIGADALSGVVQMLIGDEFAAPDRIVLVLGSEWDGAWLAAKLLAAASMSEVQSATLVRLGSRQTGVRQRGRNDRLANQAPFRLVELAEPSEPWEVTTLIERLRGLKRGDGGLVIVPVRRGAAALPQLARVADATLLVLAWARSTSVEARTLAQRLRSRTGTLQGAILIRWTA